VSTSYLFQLKKKINFAKNHYLAQEKWQGTTRMAQGM
jgi:hypothetical protein